MKNEFYQSPEPGWLMKIFWKAAGADAYLLSRSTYGDQVKYFCLGGIVIATGTMAALAGGYAFYTIFEPKGDALEKIVQASALESGEKTLSDYIHYPTVFLASIFGLIWGAIIFNIDRFIVTSTGKGDGTEAITWQELKSAFPRIIMGMIIALTISKPVEIRMFKSELDTEIGKLQEQEKIKENQKIDDYYDPLINNKLELINSEQSIIDGIDQDIKDRETLIADLQQQYIDETQGGSGNGRGIGDIANGILDQKNAEEAKLLIAKTEAEKKILPHQTKIDDYYKEIEDYKEERSDKQDSLEKKIGGLDGLLIRLKLAHEVAGFWISFFITLLFMVIELTPIFFKMMLIKGPYDYMDENIKELARAESGVEIVPEYYEENGRQMVRHKVINHLAEKLKEEKVAMIKAQTEMNLKVIEEWKNKELGKIEENPDNYFES